MLSEEKDQKDMQEESIQDENHQIQETEGDQTERCLAEISLWKDQCKRISAEFENFKKRTDREQIRWTEIAKEKLLKEMLPFVDDFERALQQEKSDNSGIQLMYQSFLKFLQKNGVTQMQSYDSFDPEMHEAVMQVESKDHQAGKVVDVFAKGFMIQDRVLRPAQVSVAK